MEDPETQMAAAGATDGYPAGNERQGIEGGRVCGRPSFRATFFGEYSYLATLEITFFCCDVGLLKSFLCKHITSLYQS